MTLYRSHGWTQMAGVLGIERCLGIRRGGGYCDRRHGRDGEVERRTGLPPIIHWADRRVTRAGIRVFLIRVAEGQLQPVPNEPLWHRRWRVLAHANDLAKQAGVRLPHALGEHDRAELRAMLVNVPGRTPGRKEAMRWSQR